MLSTLRFVLTIVALRILRWFKPVLAFMVILWALVAFSVGERFDDKCIEGRLSHNQAVAVNVLHWGYCPHEEGCAAEANDRVFVGQCSEFFKFLWRPTKWVRSLKSGEFPWQY